jgi:hypothetical protein
LLRRSDAAAETLEQTKDSKHGEQEQTNSCYENGYAEKRITGYLKNKDRRGEFQFKEKHIN